MKLSEYAEKEGIQYQAAHNRFTAGKIPGAYKDQYGRIHIPDPNTEYIDENSCVIYARVSTPGQKEDLHRQSERLKNFAISRGYTIINTVEEVASGVKDDRKKLEKLLQSYDQWSVLIVEHRDRLTRVGFGYFEMFLGLLGKTVLVADESTDSDDGKTEDILHILYSYTASEYGKRGAKNRALKAQQALDKQGE